MYLNFILNIIGTSEICFFNEVREIGCFIKSTPAISLEDGSEGATLGLRGSGLEASTVLLTKVMLA